MSTLLYTALSSETHTWLTPGNRAFKIDEGAHVGKVIQVTIQKTQEDLDLDGIPEVLNAKFTACLVDEYTGECLQESGSPIKTDSQVHTLVPNALDEAEATAQVASFMAEHINHFIYQALRKQTALIAWHQF